MAPMNQKSSRREKPQSVSQALTADIEVVWLRYLVFCLMLA